MFLRRFVSSSTLVAMTIAGITAAAVAYSMFGSSTTVTTTGATGATGATRAAGQVTEVADRASDLLVQGAGDELGLRGAIRLTLDQDVAGATAATRPIVAGECPVMTDSIRRLYLGFLEREPTADELGREIDLYQTGEANLEDLADALATSGRFRTKYGPLSDGQFITRVYANTLGAEPIEAEVGHWTTNLTNGYPRGAVMLAFTESASFVEQTRTSRPLSGYLTWYPEGTHWYCGAGPKDDLPIRSLVDDRIYADYLFINPGDRETVTGLITVLDGRRRVSMAASALPAGYTDFRWDGLFVGASNYGNAIDVVANDDTGWVVVFYPRSVGDQRLGWHVPW